MTQRAREYYQAVADALGPAQTGKTVTVEYEDGSIMMLTGVRKIYHTPDALFLTTAQGPSVWTNVQMRSLKVRSNGGPK